MINAKVLLKSKCKHNDKIICTMELEYPRGIHAEFLTHRNKSRSSASSRAIPFEKMLKQLDGKPSRFGKANKGMQDTGTEHTKRIFGILKPEAWWKIAKNVSCFFSKGFYKAGYHKQVYNRLTEPFQMVKVVVTATEWNNFFWLRCHEAADPTMQELAYKMKEAYDNAEIQELEYGQWHLPYVNYDVQNNNYWIYDEDGKDVCLCLEDAKKVSAARCAAVSFRNIEYGVKKCLEVYVRLVGDERKHASAFEHQATPMFNVTLEDDGVTHLDKKYNLWSGNFCGWIQHRQLIEGHNKEG